MGLFKKLFGKQVPKIKEEPSTPTPPPSPSSPEPEPLHINEIMVAELVEMMQSDQPITVVDLRQGWEYTSGHIPGAVSLPMMQLPYKLAEIPKDQPVVMQCYHGISSLDASGYLIENGWDSERVVSLSGGMSGWVSSQGMGSLEQDD